jgi:hypothetical protein
VEFFIVIKYVYTLNASQAEEDASTWWVILGFATKYDPNVTNMYFRYPPQPVNWALVILMFIYYRRTNILGSDSELIK